ncbi:group 1 glycosyltransferase [Stanieria sp. NIES-3757]|nr:group 1 glycosyltransferase [Stanieria sp. NIES-3757]
MHKLSVIHSFPTWLPLTQTWMYNQVYYLPEEIENHIVCDRTKNLDQFNLPNIHSLENISKLRLYWEKGLRKLNLQQSSPLLIEIAKKKQSEIVHSHFGHLACSDINTAKKANLKQIVTFYGYDVNCLPNSNPIWIKKYQKLFANVERVLCEGPHMGRCIVNLGCPPEKVIVHHLGVKINQIDYQPRTWNREEPLRILMAASFIEKKGFPDGLEALGILQHEIPLEVTIIGDASQSNPKNRKIQSQIEKEKILATIDKYKLSKKVRLLGYQPYSVFFEEAYKHHIFLSPSITASDGDTEGGAPVSIIEMAATGMPIVSTTHCDIPEVIKHGITGLLAPERDVAELVNHLRWYINHSTQWAKMLDAGRKHIETEYDAQTQGQKLAEIYQDVAKSQS